MAQNISSDAHIQRRAHIRVNMHVSYRRVLRDYNRHTNLHPRLRPSHVQALRKTSRDRLASLKAKRVVQLSSMTSQPPSNGNVINLPRFLDRPPPIPIRIDALQEVCPELTDVSDGFVRRHLSSMAPNMLAGLDITGITGDNISELPNELPVHFIDRVTPIPPVPPTHILAVSTESQPDKSTLFLIHQLPFAANCSSFPALPRSSTATSAGNRSTTATLPVIRMRFSKLPSSKTFLLFQAYLYVKDPEALRVALLHPGWTDSMEKIWERVVVIKEFWSIACSFGTIDDEMFDVVEECWAEVLRVLDQTTQYSSLASRT